MRFIRSQKDILTVKKFNKNTSGDRGFSLVEVIVVLAIMGTTLAIAMPSIINYAPHMQLKSTSMELYAALQKARSKAVGSTDRYGVELDLGTPQRHRLMTSTDRGVTWTQDTRSASYEISPRTNINNVTIGVDPFTTGTVLISFTPVGTATQAAINLENARDTTDKYHICVRSATGRVKILAGEVGC